MLHVSCNYLQLESDKEDNDSCQSSEMEDSHATVPDLGSSQVTEKSSMCHSSVTWPADIASAPTQKPQQPKVSFPLLLV